MPDGLKCDWLYLPENIDQYEMFSIGTKLAARAVEKQVQTRICIESPRKAEVLKDKLSSEIIPINIGWGGNVYFECKASELLGLRTLNSGIAWDEYGKDYTVKKMNLQSSYEREILRSLMMGSFGRSDKAKIKQIEINFDASLNDLSNIVFFVTSHEGDFLGSFLLKTIERPQEVQLHSVAGISEHPNVIKRRGKLGVIMAAVVEAVEGDRLTFSASNLARNYEQLGFAPSPRTGLVIYPH